MDYIFILVSDLLEKYSDVKNSICKSKNLISPRFIIATFLNVLKAEKTNLKLLLKRCQTISSKTGSREPLPQLFTHSQLKSPIAKKGLFYLV